MSGRLRAILVLCSLALGAAPHVAWADESDNFTCRLKPLRDSLSVLDELMNAKIRESIDRANRRGPDRCDAACLERELRTGVGGSYRQLPTFIPHAKLIRWVKERRDIERCHVEFRESIYGARRYNLPFLHPFNGGRIIFLADSIRVAGRVVGLDKLEHFIREGLVHWETVFRRGGTIRLSLMDEMGPPHPQFSWTEYGLKGYSLTGVVAYADLAAGYWGYRFWTDLLAPDQARSFVARDAAGQWVQRRPFTFAAYVNDAWDESLNCSTFDPELGPEVVAALKKLSMTCPVAGAGQDDLRSLPDARLYVSPSTYTGRMADVKLELGLDTFGDVTFDADGRLRSQAQALRDVIDEAVLADELGVDCFGVGEHHRADFAISAPEVVMAAIAARTRRLIVGSAVTVLSTDDPVRVYERFSTIHALSNGRVEIILGRGSFTESYPLFGYDLAQYDELFEEKLALFAQLVEGGAVTWSGRTRSALTDQHVYPPVEGGKLRTWVGVGGSPESVVRAARFGFPLTLAIIGGSPQRFLPYADLYRKALERFGKSPLPVAVHSPGHVADTDEAAREDVWPHYEAMMTRIGGERGWPPVTRQQFEREAGPDGALCVGSPETVAAKIARTVNALGLVRFDLKYSNGTLPHDKLMKSIELFGTRVAPRVRELAGES